MRTDCQKALVRWHPLNGCPLAQLDRRSHDSARSTCDGSTLSQGKGRERDAQMSGCITCVCVCVCVAWSAHLGKGPARYSLEPIPLSCLCLCLAAILSFSSLPHLLRSSPLPSHSLLTLRGTCSLLCPSIARHILPSVALCRVRLPPRRQLGRAVLPALPIDPSLSVPLASRVDLISATVPAF